MPGAPSLADIQAAMDAALGPLREQVAVIDAELEQLEERKRELKEIRATAARLISANDQTGRYAPKKQAPKKQAAGKTASQEKLDELEDYLRGSVNGDDFNVPELLERKDWLGMSSSYTNGLMNALHERGSVRLVKTGHPDLGARTKIWRMTK